MTRKSVTINNDAATTLPQSGILTRLACGKLLRNVHICWLYRLYGLWIAGRLKGVGQTRTALDDAAQ
jgi:hypothetical protein